MFNRISALIGALVLAAPLGAQAANPTATAVWNGDIGKSCSIAAISEGTLRYQPAQQVRDSLITSVGATPARLQINAVGGDVQVGFTEGSSRVEINGTNVLVQGKTAEHHVRFQGKPWQVTFQNSHNNVYGKQERLTVSEGQTIVSVDTKTDAHLDQDKKKVATGKYVIKTTYECISN